MNLRLPGSNLRKSLSVFSPLIFNAVVRFFCYFCQCNKSCVYIISSNVKLLIYNMILSYLGGR